MQKSAPCGAESVRARYAPAACCFPQLMSSGGFQLEGRGNRAFIKSFKATVPASPGVLFDFRQSLREWLESARLDGGPRDALVLAVHEAVANGIEHGSGSPVLVKGRVDDGEVTVEITTQGWWASQPKRHGLLDERGRGLALIRGLTNGLDVVVDDCVTLRLRAAGEESS